MPDRPLGSGRGIFDAEEFEPLALPGANVTGEQIARRGRRPEGQAGERHVRFLQGPPTLLVVAALAGRDDVLPGVLPATVAGADAVEGQIMAALAAVHAGVVVAAENFLMGHSKIGVLALYVVRESDD